MLTTLAPYNDLILVLGIGILALAFPSMVGSFSRGQPPRMAMIAIRHLVPAIPAPFNLWMNIPVAADGACSFLPTVSAPGDKVVFRAEMPCIAVISACPMDVVPINGEACEVRDLEFEVS